MPISRASPDEPGNPSFAISSLAYYGRFTHQVLEYINGYLFSVRNDIAFETPEWVGHYIFELDEPLYTYGKYIRRYNMELLLQDKSPHAAERVKSLDIFSPGSPKLSSAERHLVQSRLKIRQHWLPYLQPLIDELYGHGRTVIAFHIRRGDRTSMNDTSPTSIYLDWLRANWHCLDQPLLYIASDDLEAVKLDFSAYSPLTLSDIAQPWSGNEYLQDFYVLLHCNILGVSTGGFAYTAALLNTRAQCFLKPAEDESTLIEFDPYN